MLFQRIILTLSFYTIGLFAYSQQKANIVVAANMKSAMDSIVSIYKATYPNDQIVVTYGSSGKFYEQIMNGAPFDVFFSADMNYPEKLIKNKKAITRVKLYAIGKIVLWSKNTNPNLKKIDLLTDPEIKKISIATPTTAPYGAKSVESMNYYKIYDKVKDKLVYGENIAQTAQFVAFGAADAGFIALSDALSPKMKKENGFYYLIPQESYSPLNQGCVILKHGYKNAVAKRFYEFISSKSAVDILTYFGYSQKN
ncbi:MAG: molybdate ABC transporter substrate-binding protein [Flavobacteriales bacterium]|nr:molybdate ABC transporter substrate-binding protein [Flavobacteriales bacterium]